MRANSRRMLRDLADWTGESQEGVLDWALRLAYKKLRQQNQEDFLKFLPRNQPTASVTNDTASEKPAA